MVIYFFIALVLVALALTAAFFARGRRETAVRNWQLARRSVLLKILVPKNNEKTPLAAENLFAALHGIFRPDAQFNEHISFEVISQDKAIEFYVNCPTDLRDFIEGQIYAQYPNVDIREVNDYARADLADRKVAVTELALNKPDVFPIKTFQNFEVDPLASITGVLSHMGDNEAVWLQTLVRPISDSWQNKAFGYVAAARSGNLRGGNIFSLIIKGLVDVLKPPAPAKPAGGGGAAKLPAGQEAALKAIEEKATKLGYSVKIRIVVLAPDATTAMAKINAISGSYKQFNTININGFKVGKTVTDPEAIETYRLREFAPDDGMIMNIEELASVYHFPNASVETPNIVWAGAKKGEPPASLPIEGIVPPNELTLFASTDFRGTPQRFGIKVPDRRQHMYAIGKSGTGKSTMLENMAIDDIRKGRGVAIVDPHGDFINHVLEFVPEERIGDVIYFSPADRDHPIGFNLLENVDPALKNIVASGVVAIFEKIFGEKSWGPRLEYILRNVVLALLEYEEATMLDIMRMLVDKKFRNRVMEKVSDPVIRDFFINEYEKYDPKFRTEAIAPIQNKVGQFLSASTIRNIVGQQTSSLDIEDVMNNRKILLLDLSIGKIGEDTAALLGSMMITKIQLASMRRASIEDPEKRVDFYLYVDEFQNFATDSFAVILSEARKYRLNLILTHQYIAQLPEAVAKAVFGNIGTLISFRVGSSDSVALVKEFEPVFDANDLVNLDNHYIYAKMSIDGVTRPAFSALTLAPASNPDGFKEQIIHASRARYARSREEVEKQIAANSASAPEVAQTAAGMVSGAITRIPATTEPGETKAPTLELAGKPVSTTQDPQGRHWYIVDESKKSEITSPRPGIEGQENKDNSSTEKVGETPVQVIPSGQGGSANSSDVKQGGEQQSEVLGQEETIPIKDAPGDEITHLAPDETVVLRD